MGISHQTGMLGLKWLLPSDLWVEILSWVTALTFPERISLLLSSTQPFPELLGSGLQNPPASELFLLLILIPGLWLRQEEFHPTTDSWPLF